MWVDRLIGVTLFVPYHCFVFSYLRWMVMVEQKKFVMKQETAVQSKYFMIPKHLETFVEC